MNINSKNFRVRAGETMTASSPITTLFLDISGVLLTNGWDHNTRTRAAEKFSLDYEEMNELHHLMRYLRRRQAESGRISQARGLLSTAFCA